MPEAKPIPAPAINLVDESFDIKKSGSYHLSILSAKNNLSFTILDTSTNKYLALQSFAASVKVQDLPTFFREGGFDVPFNSVTCAVAHNKFTLVPSAVFDEENKASFLGFNHPIENDQKVHSDILTNIEARNLFTISADFESIIRKHFINAHFIHNATSFIEGLLVQNKNLPIGQVNNANKKVFADFHSSYFEIVILSGRELLFSNAFTYKGPEDTAYYILFVYEQLHLNPEEIELVLSGEIEKTAEGHALLFNYIRHVKFALLPDSFKYSYKFDEIQSHKFQSLFNQYLVTT